MSGPTELINKRAELLDKWNTVRGVYNDSFGIYADALKKGNRRDADEAEKVMALAKARMGEYEVQINSLEQQIKGMTGEYYDTH